jgi:hypothetical protein
LFDIFKEEEVAWDEIRAIKWIGNSLGTSRFQTSVGPLGIMKNCVAQADDQVFRRLVSILCRDIRQKIENDMIKEKI